MDIVEKSTARVAHPIGRSAGAGKIKFYIGGLLIVAAVIFLIASSLPGSAQYFYTVNELKSKGSSMLGQDVRISGAVVGDSIQYDADTLTLRFTIAHTPGDNAEVEAQGGLAAVLHEAVTNPNAERMEVVYKGVKPDLLRNEAQAIMTGKLGEDGVFYSSELLLKCPTKYEDAVPKQVEGE